MRKAIFSELGIGSQIPEAIERLRRVVYVSHDSYKSTAYSAARRFRLQASQQDEDLTSNVASFQFLQAVFELVN